MMFTMCLEVIGLDKGVTLVLEWGKSKCIDDVPQIMAVVPSFRI